MPRQLQPCGTRAAYQRHVKAGEDACDACLAGCARYSHDYRTGTIPKREPAKCGSLPAYYAHRYRQEKACRACLDAYTAYQRERRAARRAARAERAAALDAAWAEVLVEAGVTT